MQFVYVHRHALSAFSIDNVVANFDQNRICRIDGFVKFMTLLIYLLRKYLLPKDFDFRFIQTINLFFPLNSFFFVRHKTGKIRSKEGSTKIVIFMTSGIRLLVWRHSHIGPIVKVLSSRKKLFLYSLTKWALTEYLNNNEKDNSTKKYKSKTWKFHYLLCRFCFCHGVRMYRLNGKVHIFYKNISILWHTAFKLSTPY